MGVEGGEKKNERATDVVQDHGGEEKKKTTPRALRPRSPKDIALS